METTSLFEKLVKNNDINKINNLLKNNAIQVDYNDNWAVCYCSMSGYLDLLNLLLEQSVANPSIHDNLPIRMADKNGHKDIVEILWKQKQVKKTLNNHKSSLYKSLKIKDLKNNLTLF